MKAAWKHRLDLILDVVAAKGKKPARPPLPKLGAEFLAPGQNSEAHTGFVNCALNEKGLRALFYHDETGGIACRWTNTAWWFECYTGLIHGGVLTSLLDEVMANAVVASEGVFGVTTKMTTRWLKPVKTGETVTGSGRIVGRLGKLRLLRVQGTLFRADGKLAALAEATFFLPTAAQFARLAAVDSVPSDLKPYFAGPKKA
jgi:uncharacterized protein (TIGR00369 family)